MDNLYGLSMEDIKRLSAIETPYYVVDKRLLKKNLQILKDVEQRAGCKVLLAQKGFSMFSVFPMIGDYISGVTSSSLFEARLGYEEMGKEVHIYSPAYRESEFEEIMEYCGHIVFNSPKQYRKFRPYLEKCSKKIQCGLRVNPEYSEIEVPIYDPCFENSRMGTVASQIQAQDLEGLSGLHFHALCEQGADTLEHVLKAFEEKFGKYLYQMEWLNLGGGHHITRQDYDVDKLIGLILHLKETYDLEVYIEPGEAFALNTGFLVASVLDTMKNGMDIGLLDASAACHMPDVLEMPYRPMIIGSSEPGIKKHTYRLGGTTCLSGDIIGDYSFDEPLYEGQKLIFTDMGHYTMVKNNTFNGVNLPSIALLDAEGIHMVRTFDYEDYKNRLS